MLFDDQFAKNLDMIESVMVALAAYVAIRVALNWKRELLGTRRFEIQEEVLTKMSELREQFRGLSSSLRFIDKQNPEPEVGEVVVALKLGVEDAVKEHQAVLQKLAEIDALEVKVRLLFEPGEVDSFRHFTVARQSNFSMIAQVMGHISVLEVVLSDRDVFDASAVKIADRVSERVHKLLEGAESKTDPFSVMVAAADSFNRRFSISGPTRPATLYQRLMLRRALKKN